MISFIILWTTAFFFFISYTTKLPVCQDAHIHAPQSCSPSHVLRRLLYPSYRDTLMRYSLSLLLMHCAASCTLYAEVYSFLGWIVASFSCVAQAKQLRAPCPVLVLVVYQVLDIPARVLRYDISGRVHSSAMGRHERKVYDTPLAYTVALKFSLRGLNAYFYESIRHTWQYKSRSHLSFRSPRDWLPRPYK